MAQGFTRKRGRKPRYVAHLDVAERELLVWLLTEVEHILRPPAPETPDVGDVGDPFEALMRSAGLLDGSEADADPALERLVPDGHHDDPIAAADFRALHGPGLRETKAARLAAARDALRAVPDTTDVVELGESDAVALLVSLTDVRLVLAQRLGLQNEDDTEALDRELADAVGDRDPEDLEPAVQQRLTRAAYYDFLSWLQETLSHALEKGL